MKWSAVLRPVSPTRNHRHHPPNPHNVRVPERHFLLGRVHMAWCLLRGAVWPWRDRDRSRAAGTAFPGFLFGPLVGRAVDRFGRSRLLPIELINGAMSPLGLAFHLPLPVAVVLVTTLSLGYDDADLACRHRDRSQRASRSCDGS